jgi:hypothetical protein
MKRIFVGICFIVFMATSLSADGPGGKRLEIKEEDGTPADYYDTLKVTNGSLTDNGDGTASLAIGAGGGGHTIKDEGGAGLTARTNLNFIGAGVTATDNAGTDATDITVSGAGESTTVSDTATLDLTLTGADIKGDVITLKDLVTTAPLTGGTNDILVGADADITIAIPQATTSADGYVVQADWDSWTDHVADNTQAHSDYVVNSGDTVTGTYDFTGATVNVATPTASANAATKDYVDLAVQSHELTEYYSSTADALGGIYYIMNTTQAAAGTASTAALTNANNQTVLKFITPIALPNLATIFAGIYDSHVHVYKSGVTTGKVVTARWKMYRRLAAPSTTEDLIMTSEDVLVTSTSSAAPQVANPHAILASDFSLTADLSDRLVIYWEVDVSGGGVSVVFNITVGGTVDSHISVSIPATELNQIYVNTTGDTMTGALTINDNNAAGSTLLTIGDATDADSIQVYGAVTSGGAITSSGTFDATGAVAMVIGSGDITGLTITTDGTGNAELTLPADVIGDADIDWGTGAGQVSGADIGLTDAGAITSSGLIQTGLAGTDGQLKIYSEQGVTDYTITINPHVTMTQDVTYTLPADDGAAGQALTTDGAGALSWAAGAGYTTLSQFVGETAWRVYYSNTDGDITALALGADGTYLKSNGASSAPTFASPGGGPTYREYTFLPESCVLDDGVPPAITIIESSGTGTGRYRVADFDATTDERIYYTFVMPSDYTANSDIIVDIYWFTNDTGADEDAIWAVEWSSTTSADADSMIEFAMDADIATESGNCDTNEANRLLKTTITLTYATYLDGLASGDVCTFVLFRDADDSVGDADNDGLTSDARLVSVHLKIPRS